MDAILQGLPHVICYLNNILVTETEQEHLQNLEEVLSCLREHGVKLKQDKCLFYSRLIGILGPCGECTGYAFPREAQAVTEAPCHQISRGTFISWDNEKIITAIAICQG